MKPSFYRTKNLLTAAAMIVTALLPGCVHTRCEQSLIHPCTSGRQFQECSIDLSAYKPAQMRAGQDANIALAVAASGGGFRAASFAAGALLGLEAITAGDDIQPNVLSEADYFSSVSGGGFAVGVYMSTLYDHFYFTGTTQGYTFAHTMSKPPVDCPCRHKPGPDEHCDPCVRRHLQGLYDNFVRDFLRTILPWERLGFDKRGRRFELAMDDDILGHRWRTNKLAALSDDEIYGEKNLGRNASLMLKDVFMACEDNNSPAVFPFWVANATIYETGAIFPFTPDQLQLYRVDGYSHRLDSCRYTRHEQGYEQFIWETPLSVAVASSGNFPFALPANQLTNKLDPNNPYLYVLDGGMADNLGVVTAVRLLEIDAAPQTARRVLIVIDSYQGGLAPYSSTKKPPSIAKTAVRAMEISLDSWRGRYRELVDELCRPRNIRTIYLSFDDLAEADFNDLLEYGLTSAAISELLNDMPKNCPMPTPFHYARSISMVSPVVVTRRGLEYKMPEAQQDLLLAAGRYVVSRRKAEILAAMGWTSGVQRPRQ